MCKGFVYITRCFIQSCTNDIEIRSGVIDLVFYHKIKYSHWIFSLIISLQSMEALKRHISGMTVLSEGGIPTHQQSYGAPRTDLKRVVVPNTDQPGFKVAMVLCAVIPSSEKIMTRLPQFWRRGVCSKSRKACARVHLLLNSHFCPSELLHSDLKCVWGNFGRKWFV